MAEWTHVSGKSDHCCHCGKLSDEIFEAPITGHPFCRDCMLDNDPFYDGPMVILEDSNA